MTDNGYEICARWVRRIGWGFHPDTRGRDYFPTLGTKEILNYEADMDRLFECEDDPYDVAVHAMEEILGK